MAKKKTKELPADFTGTITVTPVLKRNPKAPLYYSPVVDIRYTDNDFRLLSFIIPPADPDELVVGDDGEYVLPVRAQCELLIPPETMGQLIPALQAQYEAFMKKKEESGE